MFPEFLRRDLGVHLSSGVLDILGIVACGRYATKRLRTKLPWLKQPLQRAWKISHAQSQRRSQQCRISRPGFVDG